MKPTAGNTRLGVVDLGTNTFHLLIAEPNGQGGFRELFRYRQFVKLAEEGIQVIGDTPFQRGLLALEGIKAKLDEYGVDRVRAFGTAALRTASNGSEFIRQVRSNTGIEIQLISGDEEARLAETASLISVAERRAMKAERETVDRLVAGYLAERKGDIFDARISGVTKAGLFVQLPEFGADGFVPVSSLGGDYYIYDESAHSLFGERGGKGYQLADRVEVRLVEVAPLAGAMRFEMLSDPKPLPQGKRSYHKATKRRSGPSARKGRAPSGPRRRR